MLDPNGLKLPQTGFLLGAQSIQSPDVSICWVHYPSLQSKSRDFVVQSSTCLNSTSKFPHLVLASQFSWLPNFLGKNPIISTSCLPISKTRGHKRRKDSRATVAAVTDCTTSWSWSQTTWPSRPSWQGRPAGW